MVVIVVKKSHNYNKKMKEMNKSELIKVTYHFANMIRTTYIKLVASFNVIWNKVIENCPANHRTSNLELFWIDEEKDEIIINNKESFDIYLSYTLGLSPHHLHVREWNANRKPKKTAAKSYNSIVHDNVECDGCFVFPIVGPMYKCMECPNYDLCQNCMLDKIHMNHDMLQISTTENKKTASSTASENSTSLNDSMESNESSNTSKDEESSSSWEDASNVSSDEDKEDMNKANPNCCLVSMYHKMVWSLTNKEANMSGITNDESSDEDSDSDSSTWETINSSDEDTGAFDYYSDFWATEESSDEEESSEKEESSDEENDKEDSNCSVSSKQSNKDKNEMSINSDDSSDGETNTTESDNDNTNCSATNTENTDNDEELNNLVASFVLI